MLDLTGKRDTVIKATYPDGSVSYGSPLPQSVADAWVRVQNRAWRNIAHEAIPVEQAIAEQRGNEPE